MAQQREVREVQNPSLLAVGSRPDVLVWRQTVGIFRGYDAPEQVIKVGTPGMADSAMIVATRITPEMVGKVVGIAAFAEFKTDTGRQSKQQKQWQSAVQQRGGIYEVVRSPLQMVSLVERIKSGRLW